MMKQGLVGSAVAMPGAARSAGGGDSGSEDSRFSPSKADLDVEGNDLAQGSEDQGGAEEDDEQYELDLEKVLLAATQAMQEPEVQDELRQIRALQDPAEGIATLAMSIVDGLDEASGATIPEDVLPGAALGIAATIGEVLDVDQAVMTQTAQTLVLRALQQEGVSPEEMQQALAQTNFAELVQQATQKLGGSDGT